MKKILRYIVVLAVAYATLPSFAAWPDRSITLIVPFGAGGNSDILARLVAQELSKELKQPVVVENRPGAGSMLGTQVVARARGDGYTFLLGGIATVLNNHLYKNPLVDAKKDLAPVALIGTIPNYLSVHPDLPVRNTKELIDYLRARPGAYSCANSGIGTSPHLSCELFRSMAKVDIVMVPYKSGAAALTDVMGGNATMVLVNEALPYIRDGRLKGLAVTSAQASVLTPDLPPIASELPGYDVTSWYGVFAPKDTPDAILIKVNSVITKFVATEASKKKLGTIGVVGADLSQPAFASFIDDELKRWGEVVRPLKLQLD